MKATHRWPFTYASLSSSEPEPQAKSIALATAARTIEELEAEIVTLRRLEGLARVVRSSGEDRKWNELAELLSEIFTPAALADTIAEPAVPYGGGELPPPVPSPGQKLVIFTEHRDTLSYLEGRITTLLGHDMQCLAPRHAMSGAILRRHRPGGHRPGGE